MVKRLLAVDIATLARKWSFELQTFQQKMHIFVGSHCSHMIVNKLGRWMSIKFDYHCVTDYSPTVAHFIDQHPTITLFSSAFYANYQLTVAIDVIGSICYLEA